MNLYTVRKATQGLADYLNASGLPKKVAIAPDSRHNGALFARETARVLAANGITACMYPRLEPTPALSWAVRYLGLSLIHIWQSPLTPRAGHARPLPRGRHRLPGGVKTPPYKAPVSGSL